MDPTVVAGWLVLIALTATAWSRSRPTHDVLQSRPHRVVVEELDSRGRVCRRVVL
jgi:hypothetical protein